MSADVPALVRVAAVTDVLLRSLEEPDVEELADDGLVRQLRDLRERVELKLRGASTTRTD